MNTDPNTNNSTMALGKRAEAVLTPTYSYDYDNPAEATAGYSRLHDYIRSARNHIWLIVGVVVVITTLVGFTWCASPMFTKPRRTCRLISKLRIPRWGRSKATRSFSMRRRRTQRTSIRRFKFSRARAC